MRRPKLKYWSKHSAYRHDWDYVVIGSGMGGMTTAAFLSKLGKRVLVIEQHYSPGGFTHTFKRPGYRWDVGVHAVGEVTRHTMTGRLLSRLTDGRLQWSPLGPVYDEFHLPGDFRIDFPDNPERLRANFVAAFPAEATAIDEYFRYSREVVRSMRGYFLSRTLPRRIAMFADLVIGRKAQDYLRERTRDVVAGLTDDPRLRMMFTAQWGYYGSTPSRSSFAIQALIVRHFMHGAYYPVGGSREIARALLKTVSDAGGWTRIASDVEKILIDKGAAVGVVLANGETIRAQRVVSAAGIAATVRRLLPDRYRRKRWAMSVEQLQPAPAHLCLYIGFKGDITRAGASPANKWFYNTWNPEDDAWNLSDPDALPDAPVLYCSFPSLKDPEHDPGPQQRHTGEVVTFVPWHTFSAWQGKRWRNRGDDYEAFKKKLRDSLLAQLLARMPGLEPMVDFTELSTPVSTDHFARPIDGSIYGLEPTPERFDNPWLRARSPIQNLFFSGSEVGTVGVIGAFVGGVLATVSAEPMAALSYLRAI